MSVLIQDQNALPDVVAAKQDIFYADDVGSLYPWNARSA